MRRFEKGVSKDNKVPMMTIFFLVVVFLLSLISCIQYDERKSTEKDLIELKESLIQYNMERYENELESTGDSDIKKSELYERTLYEIWFIEQEFYEKFNSKNIENLDSTKYEQFKGNLEVNYWFSKYPNRPMPLIPNSSEMNLYNVE